MIQESLKCSVLLFCQLPKLVTPVLIFPLLIDFSRYFIIAVMVAANCLYNVIGHLVTAIIQRPQNNAGTGKPLEPLCSMQKQSKIYDEVDYYVAQNSTKLPVSHNSQDHYTLLELFLGLLFNTAIAWSVLDLIVVFSNLSNYL